VIGVTAWIARHRLAARNLGVASHWQFESWSPFLPEHTTAVALLDRLLHHAVTVVTSGDSYRMKEARQDREAGDSAASTYRAATVPAHWSRQPA
jgi:IstB-like ATP binding protein